MQTMSNQDEFQLNWKLNQTDENQTSVELETKPKSEVIDTPSDPPLGSQTKKTISLILSWDLKLQYVTILLILSKYVKLIQTTISLIHFWISNYNTSKSF